MWISILKIITYAQAYGVQQKKVYFHTRSLVWSIWENGISKASPVVSPQSNLHKIRSYQLMPVTSYAYRWMMATQLSQKNVINNGQADIKDNRHLSICKASDANYLIIKSHMLPAPPTMKTTNQKSRLQLPRCYKLCADRKRNERSNHTPTPYFWLP